MSLSDLDQEPGDLLNQVSLEKYLSFTLPFATLIRPSIPARVAVSIT